MRFTFPIFKQRCWRKTELGLLTFCLFGSVALTSRADVVKGRIIDKNSGEPLENVEVAVSEYLQNRTVLNYYKTDSLGIFHTANIRSMETGLTFGLIGYHPQTKKLMLLGSAKDTVNIGDVRLSLSDILLRAAEVRARARAFVVKGDTVVFNPKAFRLSEGARLNELISQLPGVNEKDGKLEWMGKPVRILMEGKELFGNTSLFTQTIPAEAVENIKAYDKADDFEKRTGKKDNNEDYVLDLKIKPGFLERWYGEAKLTYETDDRYLVRGDATYLSTTDPMFVSANFGNNNSFIHNRSINSITSGGSGGKGKQQMGAAGYKHQWDTRQGRHTLENYVTADFNFMHNDRWNSHGEMQEDYMPGTDHTYRHSLTVKNEHELKPKGNVQLSLRPDTMTRITINGEVEWKRKRMWDHYREGLFNRNPYELTDEPLEGLFRHPDSLLLLPITTIRTLTKNSTEQDAFRSNLTVNYNRQLRGKSTLDVDAYYRYDEEREHVHTLRNFDYPNGQQANLHERIQNERPRTNHAVGLSARFRKWFNESLQLTAGFQSKNDFTDEDRTLYDLHLLTDGFNPSLPIPDDLLQSVIDRNNSSQEEKKTYVNEAYINSEIHLGKWRFTPNVKFACTVEEAVYLRGKLDTIAKRTEWQVNPSMRIRFAPSKTSVWETSYSYSEGLPPLYQTLNYFSDENPLHTSEGNPDLRRTAYHDASLSYFANLPKHQQQVQLSLYYNKEVDPITSQVRYNTVTGAYHTKVVNVRGGDSWNFSGRYTHYFKEKWEFGNRLNLYYRTSYSYLQQTEKMPEPILNRGRSFDISVSPSLTYRGDALICSLGGNYDFSYYDNNAFSAVQDRITHYKVYLNAEYRWRSFTFKSNFRMSGSDGYDSPDLNRIVPVWDLSASYKFLRNKATLSLGYNDILNKDKGYYGHSGPTWRAESWRYTHHNYFWTTFSYRFEAKKTK